MSREIKFRIWSVTGSCMHEWRELVEKNKIHLLANQQPAYPVMQFTGLKDKNGVEVYEGDITAMHGLDVSYYESGKYCRGVIEFVNGAFRQVFTHDDGSRYFSEIDDCVVAGNIFQDPELLK